MRKSSPALRSYQHAPEHVDNFVALDFETADNGADSACAIGLVTVRGGRIIDKQHFLIKPPRPYVMFTYIHGITWEMVKDKPTFKDLWPRIEKTLNEGDYLAAHNAPFDRRVLEACCLAAGVPAVSKKFLCTVQLARKTWNIRPTRLNNVCQHLNIELRHHEALSDAEACARIVLAAQKAQPPRAEPPAPHALLTAGLALAAAAAPLAWTRLVWSEYSLPKLVVLCVAALLAALGLALSAEGSLPSAAELDAPVLAVLGAAALATLFSSDPRQSLAGHEDGWTFGLWQLALYALLYHAAARAGERAKKTMLKAGLAGAAAASAYAVLQALGLDPFLAASDLPTGGRAVSTLGSPVYLGAYLALWLPLALHWSWDEPGEKHFGRAALSLIAAGLAATVTRAAWGAALLGVAAYAALSGKLGTLRWSAKRAGAAAALSLILVVAGSFALARRRHLGEETVRLSIWRTAAAAFAEHPVLGEGLDGFESAFRRHRRDDYIRARGMEFQAHAHNDLLQALATTGAVGTAAYAWLLCALALAAKRALDDEAGRARAAALAAGLLALWLTMEANIVSLSALACAALVAGALSRPASGAPARLAILRTAALPLAAVSVFFALRMTAADRDFRLARQAALEHRLQDAVSRFKEATAAERCSLSYREAFINYLGSLAPTAPGAARRGVVDMAASLGRDAVDCHPRTGLAYTIRGYGALLQAAAGDLSKLPAARADLDRAAESDPSLLSLLRLRLGAAKLAGDAEAAARLQSRLSELEALAQSRRG